MLSAWPGLELAELVGDEYLLERPRRFTETTSSLDTADRRLARSGVSVELTNGVWIVTVGDYGHSTFGADGDEVPSEVLAVLAGVGRGAPLERAVRSKRSGRSFVVRRRPAAGEVESESAGHLLDEDVSLLDGRRVVSRQRYVTVVGQEALVERVRRRLGERGLVERVVEADTIIGPLAPPDPLPWPLGDEPDAGTVAQRAFARTVARLIAHDPVVRLDLHPEGVHQMRVATRRLRSDVRTFRTVLSEVPAEMLDDLRWLAAMLGEVRDPDVWRERLVAAVGRLAPEDQRLTSSFVRRLVRERDGALARLHAALDTPRYHQLITQLVRFAEDPPFGQAASAPAQGVLMPPAQRAWKRLRRAARVAGRPEASVEDVHALRLSAKRFRYALDALAELEPAARAHAKRVAHLQQVLGEFNDASNGERWLRDVAARQADPQRMFVLGQLVMTQRCERELIAAAWPEAWRKVRRRRQRAWLTA